MDAWVIWLLIAVLLAAGEIATTSFFLAPFAIGAVAGGFIALIGGEQFWAVSVAMIDGAASRPSASGDDDADRATRINACRAPIRSFLFASCVLINCKSATERGRV